MRLDLMGNKPEGCLELVVPVNVCITELSLRMAPERNAAKC